MNVGIQPKPRAAALAAATLLLAAAPCFAQTERIDVPAERTGTSTPDETIIIASPDPAPATAIVTAAPAQPAAEVFRPYTETGGNAASARRPLTPAAAAPLPNPDGEIVTYVPTRPGEIPDGTLIKVSMLGDLSTRSTKAGAAFSASITEPIQHDGRVLVPAGSILDGRVTMVRGGRRIGGAAALHLEPQTVTLPDGQQYALHARVIDTGRWNDTRVDQEGTILRSDHLKGTLAAMSLTTGGAAAAGGVIGGLPGAAIGAGVGVGMSTAWWLKQDRQTDLPKDLVVVFSLTAPITISPAKDAAETPAAHPSPAGE